MSPPGVDLGRAQPARRVLRRRLNGIGRRFRDSETPALLALGVIGAACSALIVVNPNVTVSIILIPMVVGSAVLSPRVLPAFVIFLLGSLAVAMTWIVAIDDGEIPTARWVGLGIDVVIGLIILLASLQRAQLGVAGLRGESMLVDLRDRITKQSDIPELPAQWYAQGEIRSAGGSAFAGDFFVATCSRISGRLEVVVVDVSGKGVQAGTRSLLLSGAFGGLLGALPARDFLPAANDYLLAQDWDEGFATAVHLSLDLATGDFELRSAGHPPGVQLHAGSGRWFVHEVSGPILGLIPDGEFDVATGRLQSGDALLLFTDGLVETPYRDISSGIDRLLGEGERLRRVGFEDGARRLIDRIPSPGDDRALVVFHRR